MIRPLTCLCLLTLPLAGCGPTPAEFDPGKVQLGSNGKTVAPSKATPSPTPVEIAMIPFEGLWGRTAADCDPSSDDRRGTLKIEKAKIDYYAAGGPINRLVAHSPTSVTVDLNLSGFGKTSHPRTTYRLLMGGTRLERTEAAQPERILYTRC